MSKDPGVSDWTFPAEKPTRKQLELWCDALQDLTSAELVLYRSIGPYKSSTQEDGMVSLL